MKRRFSKILGVGLTLALVTSLLLTAAPVSADVSKPTVDLDEDEISVTAAYTISFRINKELVMDLGADEELGTGDDISPTITVRFPEDTDVEAVREGNVAISFTSGIGLESGEVETLTVDLNQLEDLIVEITLDTFSNLGVDGPDDPHNLGGIGAMAYVQVVITGVTNPTDPGTYTLEVMTSAEDTYVESESYDIDAPVVGGFVYVYNPSNILLATFGGKGALNAAQDPDTDYYAGADYTIVVGPGTYDLDNTLTISGKGLTFESSAGAEDTIIDVDTNVSPAIKITGDDVIVDGFTIEAGGVFVISIFGSDGAIVQNNIVTSTTFVVGIVSEASATDTTISGNTLENANIYLTAGDNTVSDNTISGSKITEGGITLQAASNGNIISGNTVSGVTAGAGIQLGHSDLPGTIDDNLIQGNTLSDNDKGIWVVSGMTLTKLEILNNVITDNEEDGILIADETWGVVVKNENGGVWVVSNVIKFNTITGNGDDGINNLDSEVDVDATFNWWGTTVADDIGDMVSADVTYEPFLTDTAEAAIVGGKAAGNVSSLDAKDDAGVKVSGVEYDDPENSTLVAEVISVLKYIANPEEAISDAIGFYDIYVVLEEGFVTDDVTAKIKFYDTAITTGSVVHFWTGDFWAECSKQEARDGLVYVTISDDTLPALDELEETIFVVVAGEVVAGLAVPAISAPESGAEDVSLKPTFAWETVADADGYDFELADNPLFVMPIASLTGDLGRLITPFYAQVTELDYSTYYYWRVKAVSADDESGWSSAVFMTVAEPVEPPAEVWTCPQCGLTYATRDALAAHAATAHPPAEPPDIVIEPPDVVLPAETPITPAWIYVIIGVGAVLVIGLIVLIVRTRRVA